VDDVGATRSGLAELLRLKGYEALEAGNGQEALNLLFSHPGVAVVVLDMNMPGSSGRWFREQQLSDPRIAHIPVILFTGARDLPADDELRFSERLRKPFAIEALLHAVRRYAS
jgi:CheY-like chemotaxis protein